MVNAVAWPALKRNLVAILRGVRPEEVEAIGDSLAAAGFEAIEVPLNSPEPFASIERLRRRLPEEVLVGAGTVLEPDDVDRLIDAGGGLVVSPNCEGSVIARTVERGLISLPGVFTATEAFAALRHRASALKVFPAAQLGTDGIKALRAVLPPDAVVGAVGGVADGDLAAYWAAGCRLFGLGSSLYRPGDTPNAVAEKARAAVAAYDRVAATS